MGGGDLNSKKSWHPNTMKNQERVWKAEQAAAQEKKRIQELQRERAVERDRTELNSMIKQNTPSGSGSNDNRLHWMYDKPDRKAQQEDYLLGKSIDKNYDNLDKQEDVIPAVARRVVGSSMLSTAGDSQVDLARKLREDPLLLVKERERAARAALLNNPLQRRRLTELLRKEQEQNKNQKSKKTKKKDKDLDKQLAAKLNALSGEKGLNLATLLASDNSDSDSSSSTEEEKSKKKKHKRDKLKKEKKTKKKKKQSSSDDSSDNDKQVKRKTEPSRYINHGENRDLDCRKRRSEDKYVKKDSNYKKSRYSSDKYGGGEDRNRKGKNDSIEYNREDFNKKQYHRQSVQNSTKDRTNDSHGRNRGMSDSERAAALAAMAAAGAERELQRGRRVAEQRAAAAEGDAPRRPRGPREARMLPDSLETRIHSNRHYIQRSHRHMDEHFARR